MSTVTFISGDLLNHPGLMAIAHGCNCQGVMGAGVAAGVRAKYPGCYKEYRDLCKQRRFKLGDVHAWKDPASGVVVFNLATQDKPGPTATITALAAALRTLEVKCSARGIKRVGIPRIGAGLGGLVWSVVKAVLEEWGDTGHDVEFLVFEEYVPAEN